jgi:hypothetical protein
MANGQWEWEAHLILAGLRRVREAQVRGIVGAGSYFIFDMGLTVSHSAKAPMRLNGFGQALLTLAPIVARSPQRA